MYTTVDYRNFDIDKIGKDVTIPKEKILKHGQLDENNNLNGIGRKVIIRNHNLDFFEG